MNLGGDRNCCIMSPALKSCVKTSAQLRIPQLIKKLHNFVDRIGCFMGIFSYESARRIGDQNVLRKGDVSMDWSAISVLLKSG